MFDLGWSEIVLIAVVAFVLLGPHDLVRVMRKVGYFVQKARLTMLTFQRMLEAAAYDEDIRRMQKELTDIKHETTGLATAAHAAADARLLSDTLTDSGPALSEVPQNEHPGTGYRDAGKDI